VPLPLLGRDKSKGLLVDGWAAEELRLVMTVMISDKTLGGYE
jgi:hypothetical protein